MLVHCEGALFLLRVGVRRLSSLPPSLTRLPPSLLSQPAFKPSPSLHQTDERVGAEVSLSLPQLLEYSAKKSQELQLKNKKRRDAIVKKLSAYDSVLDKFHTSQKKAEIEKDEKEAVLERRMKEIHEYFGYWMDPKDPRFEVMLQQKEAEEKKAEKEKKRSELQKKRIAEATRV